jgi:site-specific DNA-methyltransferase (adenine-specific)
MMIRSIKPIQQALVTVQEAIADALSRDGIAILPPGDVHDTLKLAKLLRAPFSTAVLDPWYNKGVGGVRDDYIPYVLGILDQAKEASQHIYLWGFPEIIAPFVERIPQPLRFVAWLTWYFKNNPSVIRGWRSAQMTCLHLSLPGARLYVEHFLNEAQLDKWAEGKLRYMPGPPSVIEESLLVGFVGRNEQTGHPSQKPVKVIQRLLMMTTTEGHLVLDPMSGSGTTAEAARNIGRYAVICDHSEEYTQIAEKRLNVRRLDLAGEIKAALTAQPVASPAPWPGVEATTTYTVRPASTNPARANQMAFFEKYDSGGNGAGKASKAAAKKPGPKSRG